MPSSIKVTEHTCQRIKERMGLNKKTAIGVVEIAFNKGFCAKDSKGQLSSTWRHVMNILKVVGLLFLGKWSIVL